MENPLKIKNQTKSGNIETKENKIKEQKNEIVQKLGSTETKNTIEKTDNKNNIANSINEIIPQKNEKENLYKSVMPPTMTRKAISTIDKKRGFGLERKGQEVTLKNIQRTKYSDYIINFQMLLYLINPQENIKETKVSFCSRLFFLWTLIIMRLSNKKKFNPSSIFYISWGSNVHRYKSFHRFFSEYK